MSYAWVNDWVCKTYEHNGRGPDVFDCWGLLRAVYHERTGIALPEWTIDNPARANVSRIITSHRDKGHAMEVSQPQDLDIVMVAKASKCFHVGLYIAGGVLHSSKSLGSSTYERLNDFIAVSGTVRFYRWGQ